MSPFNPREKAKQVISDGKAPADAPPSRAIGVRPPPREAAALSPPPSAEATPAAVPPPPPTPVVTTPRPAAADAAAPQAGGELPSRPRPTSRTELVSPRTSDPSPSLPGFRQYRRQLVTAHLGAPVRALIDEAVSASRSKPPPSRGVVVMEAVRATREELEREFALPPSDPVFGPPAVPRRQAPLEGGQRMTLRVSIPEAAGLGQLRDRTTLSISGLVSEAVERYWRPRLTAGRRSSGWGEHPRA